MSPVTAVTHLPDVTTFAANLAVFFAAVAAVVIGAMTAMKKIRAALVDNLKDDEKPQQRIASAVLVETQTMMMWSESNRNVCEVLHEVRDQLVELRHELELGRALRDKR